MNITQTDILRCPVCSGGFSQGEKSLLCENGHCFDKAKEGYVNLLSGCRKSGDAIGDNREMAKNRKAFLDGGYYACLADAVAKLVQGDTVLDICCGEGYYTEKIMSSAGKRQYYGFDLSREMVRLAAKRKCGATFFVANIADIPVRDESVDFAFHLFAPFHAGEFHRIMKTGGRLVTVFPGKRHLFALKEVLYDVPYENDEKIPDTGDFRLVETVTVKDRIRLEGNENIMSLLRMTPYFYHTPTEGLQRISTLDSLETEVEFVLAVMRK